MECTHGARGSVHHLTSAVHQQGWIRRDTQDGRGKREDRVRGRVVGWLVVYGR